MEPCKPEAQAVIDVVKELHQAGLVKLPDGQSVLMVPKGLEARSTKPFEDERRTAPERRKGRATFHDVESFVAWVNRFKDEHTAIFANPSLSSPSMTAVIDYHEKGHKGAPRFGEHRAHYGFPLSDEWQAWQAATKRKMSQEDFAEFIESRILDVISAADLSAETAEMLKVIGSPCSPSRLMELAKGLQVNVNKNVKNAVNTATGETQFRFEESHADATGAPVSVPTCFVIAIPVFRGGDEYPLIVRLRYRVAEARIVWFVEPFRADDSFSNAFNGARDQVAKATDLPVFLGSPEA